MCVCVCLCLIHILKTPVWTDFMIINWVKITKHSKTLVNVSSVLLVLSKLLGILYYCDKGTEYAAICSYKLSVDSMNEAYFFR